MINVCYVSDADDFKVICRDVKLIEAFEGVASKIPRKQSKIKDMCIVIVKLLRDQKNTDTRRFATFTQWNFNYGITDWNKTTYPNGVQDLPADVRNVLREGSRAKLVVAGGPRLPFHWKASQDLQMFQWKTSDNKNEIYVNQIPFGHIKRITRGTTTQTLQNCAAKDRKVNANLCMTVFGPTNEEFPNGLELNLKFKSKNERDQTLYLYCEWRDALTQGA